MLWAWTANSEKKVYTIVDSTDRKACSYRSYVVPFRMTTFRWPLGAKKRVLSLGPQSVLTHRTGLLVLWLRLGDKPSGEPLVPRSIVPGLERGGRDQPRATEPFFHRWCEALRSAGVRARCARFCCFASVS